jgi:hypothetical protein
MYPQSIRYLTEPSAGPIVRYFGSHEARHGVECPLCATLGQHFSYLHQHFLLLLQTLTAETWRFQHHVGKLLPFLPGSVEATHLEYLRPKVSHFVSVSVSMCRSHVLPEESEALLLARQSTCVQEWIRPSESRLGHILQVEVPLRSSYIFLSSNSPDVVASSS